MKFLIFVCLLGLGSSEPLPKFSMIDDRSMDEEPTIAIVFPDGSTDTLVLDKYYLNEDDRKAGVNRCNFIGHLAEETGACVGMTGCPESEDVEFTIMSSRLNGSPMFKWARNGNVERVMHPYMEKVIENRADQPLTTPEHDVEVMAEDAEDFENEPTDVMFTHEEETAFVELEKMCDSGNCDEPPATNKLQLKVAYDKTFLGKFSGSHDNAKSKIEAAFVHVQTYYCHSSLGAKLKLDRIGDIMHIDDTINTEHLYSSKVLGITKKNIGTADLMVHMSGLSNSGCTNGGGCLLGIAGCLGCVCDKEVGDSSSRNWRVYKPKYWGRHNANYYRGNLLQYAYTIGHEIGHNLGLWHDHSKWHKEVGCDQKGLMSYGSGIPLQWSQCSKKDFKTYYNHATKVQKLSWCMEAEAIPACGTAPGPQPPSKKCCAELNIKDSGYLYNIDFKADGKSNGKPKYKGSSSSLTISLEYENTTSAQGWVIQIVFDATWKSILYSSTKNVNCPSEIGPNDWKSAYSFTKITSVACKK